MMGDAVEFEGDSLVDVRGIDLGDQPTRLVEDPVFEPRSPEPIGRQLVGEPATPVRKRNGGVGSAALERSAGHGCPRPPPLPVSSQRFVDPLRRGHAAPHRLVEESMKCDLIRCR